MAKKNQNLYLYSLAWAYTISVQISFIYTLKSQFKYKRYLCKVLWIDFITWLTARYNFLKVSKMKILWQQNHKVFITKSPRTWWFSIFAKSFFYSFFFQTYRGHWAMQGTHRKNICKPRSYGFSDLRRDSLVEVSFSAFSRPLKWSLNRDPF